MVRLFPPRIATAILLFAFAAGSAAPASARTIAPAPGERIYAAVVLSLNPSLKLAKARAYARSVMADAWRTHLDPRFIMSIVTVESAWRSNAVSRVGARGLGQLMPGTAATLGVNPRNPAENLRGTSNYLATLMTRFAGRPNAVKLAIAGYNAGPRAVLRFNGIPPYAETRNYVTRVLHVWKQLNARVGRAFAPAPVAALAVDESPDVREWVSDVNAVLPMQLPLVPATQPVATSAAAGSPAAASAAAPDATAQP